MVMISEGRERTQSIGAGTVIKAETVLITSASGGEAIGSGLQTSGFVVNNIIVKVPVIFASGVPSYNFFVNSGDITQGIWIGGATPYRPFKGSGFIASGRGLFIGPGAEVKLEPLNLGYIRAAAETSGSPITYICEMVKVQA